MVLDAGAVEEKLVVDVSELQDGETSVSFADGYDEIEVNVHYHEFHAQPQRVGLLEYLILWLFLLLLFVLSEHILDYLDDGSGLPVHINTGHLDEQSGLLVLIQRVRVLVPAEL